MLKIIDQKVKNGKIIKVLEEISFRDEKQIYRREDRDEKNVID